MPFPPRKAGAAKASAKSGAPAAKKSGVKKKRKPLPTFKPPADMKDCFVEMTFVTGTDGLISPKLKIERVKGGWKLRDEDGKPKNRRYNMFEYDPVTAAAMVGRFTAPMWKTSAEKRLPGNSTFRVVFRVATNKEEKLAVRIPAVFQVQEVRGKNKLVELTESTDLNRRLIRRVAKYMPGAFTNMQLPPVGRVKKTDDPDE